MSGPFGSQQWMYATGTQPLYPYTIDNSLRFDGSSSYMYYVPSTSTSRTQWTFSAWVKRSTLGTIQVLLLAWDYQTGVDNQTLLSFNADDAIVLLRYNSGTYWEERTTARVFRDTSSWYHIVWALDATNATLALRSRLYVNGEEIPYSDFTTTAAPSATGSSYLCTAGVQTNIGAYVDNQPNSNYTTPTNIFGGYVADAQLIDGSVLDPTSFGQLKSGIWTPKDYTGSYGTNGFHLDFADGTSATTLGYDAAGSNDFTPSGIATSDQMLDSPTNNFCTVNPLKIGSVTLSEGNLQHQHSGSTSWRGITPTMHVSSGKWYWEVAFSNLYTPPSSTTQALVGIVSENETQTDVTAATYFTGITAEAYGYYNYGGSIWNNNSGTAYGSTWGNATIGIALDLDSSPKTLEFFLNGVSQGVLQDGTHINLGDKAWGPGASTYYSSIASYNFGQFDFTYTPPSGFLALCSENLPAPTFDPAQGESPLDVFNSVLYDGNGTDAHAITGVGFSPDFTWIKARGPNTRYHRLIDTARGATHSLSTNLDAAEAINSTHLQSFDADGFTVGTQTSFNASGETYVGWNWKANGAGSTNSDGSITTTVSANQNSGFSIIKYTGNGTSGATIGHGLSDVPKFIIIKNRTNATRSWLVYHESISSTPQNSYLVLNSTAGFGTNATAWNNTAPNSSVVTLGSSVWCNENTAEFIAYCFSEKEGFSKFGSYVGNGSSDGSFIYTGFKPAFVMTKSLSSGYGGWLMSDNMRPGYNQNDDTFLANDAAIEAAYQSIDLLSNGFKLRSASTNTAYYSNVNNDTSVYIAFAETPFKYSLGA